MELQIIQMVNQGIQVSEKVLINALDDFNIRLSILNENYDAKKSASASKIKNKPSL